MAGRVAGVCVLMTLAMTASTHAQTGGPSGTSTGQSTITSQTQSSSTDTETRPATTMLFGDTGLWYVPTAEVLAHGKWSLSGYRRGKNCVQRSTNGGDFAGTVGVGWAIAPELFGSFLFDTRIDRDVQPLFIVNNSTFGGIVDRYPRVNQYRTGDNVGDLYVGAKVNLLSEYRKNPVAFALRGLVVNLQR
jgi:hypothetical protein